MRNILVAVDFSNATPAVVRAASEMARTLGCRLYAVHVDATDSIDVGVGLESPAGRDALASLLREEHRALIALGEELRAQGLDVKTLLRRGDPEDVAGAIVAEADRLRPYLIVVGSHGHGVLHHLLLGGVSTGVLRRAPCPVLVVPARPAAAEDRPPPSGLAGLTL